MTENNSKPKRIIEKSEARLAAVKALYSNISTDIPNNPDLLVQEIINYYQENQEEVAGASLDSKFLRVLIEGVITNQEHLDEIVIPNLSNEWRFERLSPILQSILRLATFELDQIETTPHKAIINEYVDLTHAYFNESEVGFINGILETIAAKVRDDGGV